MKGFVIRWAMKWYDDQPLFVIYQVPLECVSDFCVVSQGFKDKRDDLPLAFIECQIIAKNKRQAIVKFAKEYKVPTRGNIYCGLNFY